MDVRSGRSLGLRLALFCLATLAGLSLMGAPSHAANYTISGDWVIGPGQTVSNVSDNITVYGDVIIQGTLVLQNCTLNVTYLPFPPPPQVARLGHVVVTGNFSMTNTTLTFDVGLGGTLTVPNGFRVGPSGNVVIRDFDGNPSTPNDASHVVASRSGTYSTFAAGSTLTIVNSYINDAGWAGYPGFALTGIQVDFQHAHFVNRPIGLPLVSADFAVIRARSGVAGSLGNSTFNTTGVPADVDFAAIDVQASPMLWLNVLKVEGFRRGVVWANDAGAYIYDITFIGHGTGVEFSNMLNSSMRGITSGGAGVFPPGTGWPPDRALVAIRQSQRIRVTETRGDAGLAGAGSPAPTLFVVQGSQDAYISGVDSDLPATLGSVSNSPWVSVSNVTATGLVGGLSLFNSNFSRVWNLTASGPGAQLAVLSSLGIQISDVDISRGPGVAIFVDASESLAIARASADAETGLFALESGDMEIVELSLNVTGVAVSLYNCSFVNLMELAVTGTGSGLALSNVEQFLLLNATVQYRDRGIDAYDLGPSLLERASFTSAPGMEAGELVWIRYSYGFTLSNMSFSGNCTSLGRIQNSDSALVVNLTASGCQRGIEFESTSDVFVRNVELTGIWNGTGLTVDRGTDIWMEDVRMDRTADLLPNFKLLPVDKKPWEKRAPRK